jgi:hypothetical protein
MSNEPVRHRSNSPWLALAGKPGLRSQGKPRVFIQGRRLVAVGMACALFVPPLAAHLVSEDNVRRQVRLPWVSFGSDAGSP